MSTMSTMSAMSTMSTISTMSNSGCARQIDYYNGIIKTALKGIRGSGNGLRRLKDYYKPETPVADASNGDLMHNSSIAPRTCSGFFFGAVVVDAFLAMLSIFAFA